ncbi:potassium channel family protein [Streptomyces sp. NBC_00576]|uniref:potassium channel family protein n=1 Tax=Streptomyces sp. NBC_00576 TaxID=2903665 RepID=UPI002E805C67|nr:potassium channel family protein [Streptomyces sp. NBC_00576]WUB73066.1 potassium channel family protein [Streptomyces sp. NBC_00576]
MSDARAARTDRTGSEPGEPRRHRRLRGGRWAAFAALARAVLIAVGLVAGYYLLPFDDRGTARTTALLVCGLVAVLLVFSWEVRSIVRSTHPRLKAVEALAATLVLFLVLFASAYYLLERSARGSFSEPLTRTDALYFALTTFSTVGFGDITARSQTGRLLTMVQMAGGLLLVGVAARVLAGAVQAGLRRKGRESSTQSRSGTDPGPPDQEAGP